MGLMQNLQNRGTVPISLPSPIPSVNFSTARLSPNKVSYLPLSKLGQFNSLKLFFHSVYRSFRVPVLHQIIQ